ncbi:MBL fold metallo-hydrolase [Mitsuokella jalaludinii]|uniref:MBL fold metallo-hydrolase n=1 Tax=Mitsuokella jalaludinii TaxID=187979 RepID=UPI003080F7F7
MLDIAVYASGSSGNCYTVSDGETVVMLDCGLPFRRIERLTGFLLPKAVFVTHEHKDHSKAAQDFMRRGVDAYMTAGTAAALGIEAQHRLHILNPMEQTTVGRITVSAFPTQHDAREPCGFLLDDGDDRVLYATDTYYIKYQFPGVTKMLIEANHSYKILEENVGAHILNESLAERLIKSHFSIENVLAFLKANDLSELKEIWLIHLSDGNADAGKFARMVEAATGKPVYIGGR